MNIITSYIPIDKLIATVQAHANATFEYTGTRRVYIDGSVKKALKPFVDRLRPDLHVCVESPYMDEVYRNSYYHYYSGKFEVYPKDCIRLSFFKQPVSADDFRNHSRRAFLQEQYLGFLIIRPTLRNMIGRNVLNPKAFHETIGATCQTTFATSSNCIKLTVSGFPHSGQDAETMTCAQTTLWAIMEYFSHRYPHYKLTFPSEISRQLEPLLFERLMPAAGLHIHHISYLLRNFGFGPRMYTQATYQSDFMALFSCYIESGIPVVASIQSKATLTTHAVLCIGRKAINTDQLAKYLEDSQLVPEQNKPPVYDSDNWPNKEYVFIDDNLPPYAQAAFEGTTATFTRNDGAEYSMNAFVVPLHRHVYLEAPNAKRYILGMLAEKIIDLTGYRDVSLKFFLTSSRSYKDYAATNPTMQTELQKAITATLLPEFIWVGELSTPKYLQQNQALGVVLLDASEADIRNHNPLIIAAFDQNICNFAAVLPSEAKLNVPVTPFGQYQNNLTF